MAIKLTRKEELKEKFRMVRESKWLTIGIFVGILGSLIAGVINDLIKNSVIYPWIYLSILSIIFLIMIFLCAEQYISWKVYLRKVNRWMAEASKVLNKKW